LSETDIEVNGEQLVLDVSGALYWPRLETLVFADLHFEKGSSFARWGQFLPPYDSRTTLALMATALARRKARRVIALGDSFHDPDAATRLGGFERDQLSEMVAQTEWIWVCGNHDPEPPVWLGGSLAEMVALGGLVFRHEPSRVDGLGEVAGHLHPCTTVAARGQTLRRRCFISDGSRVVLPAFGAYAGGLDILDGAISSLFRGAVSAYVLGLSRVYRVVAG
jgi:DNA ligase-associated metallophosphoesterase